jgi:hypothetical protein
VKHLGSLSDNEASCFIRLSVASEAYGDYGLFVLFTICFTCYIQIIERLFSYRSVSRCHQEAPRRFKTLPRGFKTHLIWLQDGLRRSKTHLRHYKTSNIDQLGRLGLMHKTTGVFMHKTMSTNCVCKALTVFKLLRFACKTLQNVYDVVIMLTRRSNMLPRGSKTLLIPV